MDTQEVIVNLWYVMDEQGVIYSLRAKAYVVSGSDDSKLQFLRDRANTDYLIAQPFTIPERFHVQIGEGRQAKVMPVAHVSMLDTLDSPIALLKMR